MKIYIASSWKNQHAVEMMTRLLRERGHEVVSFVEKAIDDEGRTGVRRDLDKWIESEAGEDKFVFDLQAATQSDCVVYIGPSGIDAWAEIGAAWSKGIPIIGLWSKGEQAGLMRRMVTWCHDYNEILNYVEPTYVGK